MESGVPISTPLSGLTSVPAAARMSMAGRVTVIEIRMSIHQRPGCVDVSCLDDRIAGQ
jgi:hypothetical protein